VVGKDPLALQALLELSGDGAALREIPLSFITAWEPIRRVSKQITLAAGSIEHPVLIGYLNDSENPDAALSFVKAASARVVIWDVLSPTRRVSIAIGEETRL